MIPRGVTTKSGVSSHPLERNLSMFDFTNGGSFAFVSLLDGQARKKNGAEDYLLTVLLISKIEPIARAMVMVLSE